MDYTAGKSIFSIYIYIYAHVCLAPVSVHILCRQDYVEKRKLRGKKKKYVYVEFTTYQLTGFLRRVWFLWTVVLLGRPVQSWPAFTQPSAVCEAAELFKTNRCPVNRFVCLFRWNSSDQWNATRGFGLALLAGYTHHIKLPPADLSYSRVNACHVSIHHILDIPVARPRPLIKGIWDHLFRA